MRQQTDAVTAGVHYHIIRARVPERQFPFDQEYFQ